jgi:hypothetical protein
MIARLPEMHRQLRELAAQVAKLLTTASPANDADVSPGTETVGSSGSSGAPPVDPAGE